MDSDLEREIVNIEIFYSFYQDDSYIVVGESGRLGIPLFLTEGAFGGFFEDKGVSKGMAPCDNSQDSYFEDYEIVHGSPLMTFYMYTEALDYLAIFADRWDYTLNRVRHPKSRSTYELLNRFGESRKLNKFGIDEALNV